MIIEKGYFSIELDYNEALDIGTLTLEDWREIEKRGKQIMEAKQTTNDKVAFVAGFLNYVAEKQAMKQPFHAQSGKH